MTKRERTDFGSRLYQARMHAKLKQEQLAKKVGMSQSTLGELEYDGQGSSFTPQIAAVCGVSPEWLATGKGSMTALPDTIRPEIAKAAAAINALPKRQREWAMVVVQQTISAAEEAAREAAQISSHGEDQKTPSTKRGNGG